MKLKKLLLKKNNDYSKFELNFYSRFRKNFIKGNLKNKFSESISIIIPIRNSKYLQKTLLSISLQNYDLNNVEIILVFDGKVSKVKNYFGLNIKTFNLKRNMGAAFSRNIGLANSRNKYILFLDSDTILPKNFLSNHIGRHLISNSLLTMSLRKNLTHCSNIISSKNILQGFNFDLKDVDDFRFYKKLDNLYNYKLNDEVFLLNETNYFKDFGNGKKIKLWTLPMMVNTHNVMLLKRNAIKIGGFNKKFKLAQWEDVEFGAKAIASGLKIVPILSCNVVSIKDNMEYSKKVSFNKNEKIYLKELEKEFILINKNVFLKNIGVVR